MSGSPTEDSHHQPESNCKSTAIDRCRHSPRLLSPQNNASTANSTKRTPQLNNTNEEEKKKKKKKITTTKKVSFVGDPIPQHDACTRWPHRYPNINNNNKSLQIGDSSKKVTAQNDGDEEKLVLNVKCHYTQAEILRKVFELGDCAYVKGPKGGSNYVGKILEFFETIDGGEYFRVQWFFRAEDTVIKDIGKYHDKKRLFYSTLMNDNLLDCIVSKVTVVQLATTVNLKAECLPPCDFYFDMKYCVDYSTFSSIITDNQCTHFPHSNPLIMPTSNQVGNCKICTECNVDETISKKNIKHELALLDLYSGCGGMSTGLCMGAEACGVDLVTKWAIDIDKAACESLRLNHPQTKIRNEPAENFLNLLMEWDQMCKIYEKYEDEELELGATEEADQDKRSKTDEKDSCEYEVEKLVAICHGDPNETGKRGIKFQVRWVGYGPADDTWEPIESLSNCEERIREFVLEGMKTKILPRPGDVAVICGGPPCQGISGYNRFRNVNSPLDDERNHQIVVFMDIIDFLRPKYVLMENVIDILRFSNGFLGRYAISRLVRMQYQSRLGIMAAGCYGLPQFRMRVFLWGAQPHEILPQFPLPSHDVVVQYGFPGDFERNVVAFEEGQSRDLEQLIVLSDAISDLPSVANDEKCDQMQYIKAPETEFQKYIRAAKCDMTAHSNDKRMTNNTVLRDHLPQPLNEDDYMRVCMIPKRKGASFRDLPGIIIGSDNAVRRTKDETLMPSGKPWVPDYAINFRDGRSNKPFGRLWWDETVSTVLCSMDPHSRAVLHPEQDRVLTVRECARLQGFHDHYMFYGKLKQRYSQVGNAVAVSVGRALGYTLGMAMQKLSTDEHVMTLPPKFSHSTTVELQSLLDKF